jgi:hypothetical protein
MSNERLGDADIDEAGHEALVRWVLETIPGARVEGNIVHIKDLRTATQNKKFRHVAEVDDALTDCMACGTQIGVLLWCSGDPFIQVCPACGVLITATRSDGYAEAWPTEADKVSFRA